MVRDTPQNTTQWKETNHSSHSSSELIQEHTSPAASETSWQNGQPRGTKGCPSRTCPHGRTESNSSGGMGEQRAGLLFRTQELQAALQKFLQVPRTSPERPGPICSQEDLLVDRAGAGTQALLSEVSAKQGELKAFYLSPQLCTGQKLPWTNLIPLWSSESSLGQLGVGWLETEAVYGKFQAIIIARSQWPRDINSLKTNWC